MLIWRKGLVSNVQKHYAKATMTPNEKNEREQIAQAVREARRTLFDRPVTPQEFYALLSLYPYLEVCSKGAFMPPLGTEPTIITTKNGWKIYDYGDVMATGCHELIARLWVEEDSEDGGGEGGGDYGTIVKQSAEVVKYMFMLAKQKGWPSSEIISGHYPLQRLYWAFAMLSNYKIDNFNPGLEDYVVLRWIQALEAKTFVMPRYAQTGRGR